MVSEKVLRTNAVILMLEKRTNAADIGKVFGALLTNLSKALTVYAMTCNS